LENRRGGHLKKARPFWERAYKGHAYWQGKAKLGKVTLLEKSRYAWEAAGRAGEADTLVRAKTAVEQAIFTAAKQLDLFQP
jgi:hypothetical protein